MNYEVILLKQARLFIDILQLKLKAKTLRTIGLLEEFGPFLTEPHSKKISGASALSELRIKQSSDICRLFYFHHEQKFYIITSGYVKKEKRTKKSEIEKAKRLMTQYLEEINE